MSTLMDGINNINSLTTQIEKLKSLDPNDPNLVDSIQFSLQQNFNQMLNDLMSSSKDDDEENNKNDMFGMITDYQQTMANLNVKKAPATLPGSGLNLEPLF